MSDGLVMICDVDLGESDATRVHTVEVARGFASERLNVDLLCRGRDPQIPGVRYTRALGTDFQRVRRLLSLNAQIPKLLWMRRHSARRLYVRHRWSLMLALLVGRALGYHIVTQVDDIPYGRGYEPDVSSIADHLQRICAIAMGRLAHGVVAVTAEIKGLLVEQFGVPAANIAVLPNGADIDFFRPQPRLEALERLGLDPKLRYLVFCGHFAPWVDFDTLLDGFAITVRNQPGARLVLVGDGSERPQVEDRARRLGIEDTIIITGFIQDRATVRDYIAASVATLSANRLEHRARVGVSPVKVAEYLACGRAIVATDLPGLRQVLVDTSAGIVVPVDSIAMGAAMLEVLNPDRSDELGANGRRVAEERFAWPLIVKRTLPLFGI